MLAFQPNTQDCYWTEAHKSSDIEYNYEGSSQTGEIGCSIPKKIKYLHTAVTPRLQRLQTVTK